MARARKIRTEKLRKHHYREEYAKSLEGKKVEWYGENNGEYIWEQVKRAMVVSARELCGSLLIGCGNPKSVWWNDPVKATVKRGCLEGSVGS